MFNYFQAFEDFEFSQMEEEAKRESEKDEMSREIAELTRQLRHHERQLGGIEDQQRKVLEAVRSETKRLEQRRLELVRGIEMERVNLISLEHRLSR